MQITIKGHTFTVVDEMKMRQTKELHTLAKKLENKEIDEITMSMMGIVILITSIDENTDKSTFYDFMLDEMTPEDFKELQEKCNYIFEWFVKKNEIMTTSMPLSSESESENSHQNGTKSLSATEWSGHTTNT